MKFIRFKLVVDNPEMPAEAFIKSEYIEFIADGKPFHNKDITQICMRSGHKFFVKHTYEEVIKMLEGENK